LGDIESDAFEYLAPAENQIDVMKTRHRRAARRADVI